MATHQQMLDDAVNDQPAMNMEEHSAVRGNTCTVLKWHLEQTPVERKSDVPLLPIQEQNRLTPSVVEAERRAILEAEEASALRVRFKVTPAELEKSETEWKDWVSKRSRDFVSSWRDSIPASTAEQGRSETVNATRFGKVVNAQHDECVLCEAMEAIRMDPELTHQTKLQRLRQLEHTIPKLQMSTVTGGTTAAEILDDPNFDDLVNAPTWENRSAPSVQKHTAAPGKGLFNGISFRPEKLENTIDIQEGQWKISRSITKALVKSVGGDKEILDEVSNQKPFDEYSKAVKQRVNLYKHNKETARFALKNRLDHDHIEKAARAKADAEELERDLALLQSTLNATRARLEHLKNGNGRSVLKFDKMFCQMRRYKWNAGLNMEEEGIRYRPAVPGLVAEKDNSPFGKIRRMRDNYQEHRSLRDSPPPPGEKSPDLNTPPAQSTSFQSVERKNGSSAKLAMGPKATETHIEDGATSIAMDEPTEALFDGRNPFAKPMQEGNASFSIESSTIGLENAFSLESTTNEATGPSTEVATAASAKSKGKAKKDSKVDDLLEEDGISLKDFASEGEQKKGRPLRKLSVKAGSSSRPIPGSSSRPAWKP